MVIASIITPVWNKHYLTQEFLSRHWLHLRQLPIELIVIDNGSTDNTPHVLGRWQDHYGYRLQVITNEKNRGFGPANNQGAEIASADTLIFLSNDVVVSGDYITPITEALDRDCDALVGAELLSHNTGWNTFSGNAPIPYITGWCVACTKSTFAALGGWDERYIPCDYEDLDLSYTAAQQHRKLKALNLPLTHLSGVSGTQLPDRYGMTERHKILFAEKWGLNEPVGK